MLSSRPRRPSAPLAALLLFLLAASASAGTPWTAEDSAAAARFVDGFVQTPQKIDSLIGGPGNFAREHELGFGYRLREAWVNPAGKLGFALKIVYEGRRPLSFEVKPILNYGDLLPHYQALLAPAFGKPGNTEVTGVDGFAPYYWNLGAAAGPLAPDSLVPAGGARPPWADPAPETRKALAFYMTPYSGIVYGARGGDNGQLLENRDRFLGLAETLMPDKSRARYLLRSLNPATRLTAAEFIVRHRGDFPDYDDLLRTALGRVFAHPAKVQTMRGANVSEEDARKLVFEYARMEIRRDGRGVLRMY